MHKQIPVTPDEGYKEMAQNEEREVEAVEWCNALASRATPMVLSNQIDDLEDYSLGMETLERIRKGEEAVYSESEARRELGLED